MTRPRVGDLHPIAMNIAGKARSYSTKRVAE
jgi:hypothetical protein